MLVTPTKSWLLNACIPWAGQKGKTFCQCVLGNEMTNAPNLPSTYQYLCLLMDAYSC